MNINHSDLTSIMETQTQSETIELVLTALTMQQDHDQNYLVKIDIDEAWNLYHCLREELLY